ncbi:MAG: DUF3291 domain-containing protein [bacterium]
MTESTVWHLVQLNVAYAAAPLDSPQLADFMAALVPINALADASPGFVWRLVGSGDNATDVTVDGRPGLLVNMSVWASAEALFDFVYKSAHAKIMARRREFFQKMDVFLVLYWVPAGHMPTMQEAIAKLEHLRAHGPTPEAFTFKQRFPPPGMPGDPVNMRPEPYCVL